MPTTGHRVHAPPNQCWTAEYQSNVVGNRTKPTMGQSNEVKRPSNQWVKNQRSPTASRGAKNARTTRTQGMARRTAQFPDPLLGAASALA